MPLHPITFLWVQQQEYERGMTSQEVERAARLAARARTAPSERMPVLQPVVAPGGSGGLGRWFQKLSDRRSPISAIAGLDPPPPRPAQLGLDAGLRRPTPSSFGVGRQTPRAYHPGHGSPAVQPRVRRQNQRA